MEHSGAALPERSKRALRAGALARRAELPAAVLAAAGTALREAVLPLVAPGALVASYSSFGTEPPTGPLHSALADAGVRVLLPVLLPDRDLAWECDGEALGPEAVAGCELLVVPALLVARDGVRLGRGGGSYDRALARARGRVVAALHDGELVDALPREPHDRPVDAVVTPATGLLPLSAPWTA